MLGTEFRILHMPSRFSTTELHSKAIRFSHSVKRILEGKESPLAVPGAACEVGVCICVCVRTPNHCLGHPQNQTGFWPPCLHPRSLLCREHTLGTGLTRRFLYDCFPLATVWDIPWSKARRRQCLPLLPCQVWSPRSGRKQHSSSPGLRPVGVNQCLFKLKVAVPEATSSSGLPLTPRCSGWP